MSVIPRSQLSLMRKRRELKQLMDAGEWQRILQLESDLFAEIDMAVQDSNRSPQDLLKELGQVIRLYRELSDACYLYGQSTPQPQR